MHSAVLVTTRESRVTAEFKFISVISSRISHTLGYFIKLLDELIISSKVGEGDILFPFVIVFAKLSVY